MKKYIPENPVFSTEFNIIERADLVNAQTHNASVMQLMDNEAALKKQIDSCLGSVEGDKPQFADGIKSDNVVDAVNEVFQLGSEKKAQLAENLTAMGTTSSADETWEQLLDKVLDMTDTSGDTVTAPVLLTGYTAHDASGEQIGGNMPEMAAVTVEAVSTTQDSEYTYLEMPEGHYDAASKVRTKNSNITPQYTYQTLNLEFGADSTLTKTAYTSFPNKALGVSKQSHAWGGKTRYNISVTGNTITYSRDASTSNVSTCLSVTFIGY